MASRPLLLDLEGAHVLCVGGGPVARAKVAPLVEAGARLTVIAPTCEPDLAALGTWEARAWQDGDLDRDPPVALVVAATGVVEVDGAVAAAAAAKGRWCLRIDGRGTVAVPAVVQREGLVIALSTGAPALTRRLREHLDEVLGDRWGAAATVLADLRTDPTVRRALADHPSEARRAAWHAAVDAALAGATPTEVRAALTPPPRTP